VDRQLHQVPAHRQVGLEAAAVARVEEQEELEEDNFLGQ